jgi:hypothetical protein
MKHILSPILLSLFLTACGGGGSSVTPNTEIPKPIISATLYDTSYKNFKLNADDSIKYPIYHLRYGGDPYAVGFGEFLASGELSVFVAYQNYLPWEPYTQVQANPSNYASEYVFYSVNNDKTLTKKISLKGCLHPGKALVADFNKDSIPDIFVVCGGFDGESHPGEKSQLILSSGRGQYSITDVNIDMMHNASAADINGDGYPDIVGIHNADQTAYIYINQKNGTFVKDTSIKINNLPKGAYFNIELIDLNKDNKLDIVIGGHEFEGATTKVLYTGNDGMLGASVLNIPMNKEKDIVGDFTLVGDTLYIGRTTNPSSYKGLSIQGYNLLTGASTIANDIVTNYVPWIIPKTRNNQLGAGPYNSSVFFQ